MSLLRRRASTSKVFLISVIDDDDARKDLAHKISKLGGTYLPIQACKASCTHVICGKLTRSEEYLGACATGKWVLHPSYVTDSDLAGAWLDEEQYEWCDENISKQYPSDPELSFSSRRWRFMLGAQEGAFTGWKVAVVAGKKRSTVVKRLLNSGGAELYNLKLPLTNPSKIVNILGYIFVTDQYISQVSSLMEYGMLCIKPEFIAEYLLKDPPADPMDFLVQSSSTAADESSDFLNATQSTHSCAASTPVIITHDYGEPNETRVQSKGKGKGKKSKQNQSVRRPDPNVMVINLEADEPVSGTSMEVDITGDVNLIEDKNVVDVNQDSWYKDVIIKSESRNITGTSGASGCNVIDLTGDSDDDGNDKQEVLPVAQANHTIADSPAGAADANEDDANEDDDAEILTASIFLSQPSSSQKPKRENETKVSDTVLTQPTSTPAKGITARKLASITNMSPITKFFKPSSQPIDHPRTSAGPCSVTTSSGTPSSVTTSSGTLSSVTTSSVTTSSGTPSSVTTSPGTQSSVTTSSGTLSSVTTSSVTTSSGTPSSVTTSSGTQCSVTTSSGTPSSVTTSSGTQCSVTTSNGTTSSITTSCGTQSSVTPSPVSPSSGTSSAEDKTTTGDRLAILHSMLDVSIKTKAWTKPSTNPEYMDIAESEAIKREAIKQEAEKRNDRVAVLDGMLATATCRYLQSTGQTWLETDMVKNISRNSDSSVENYPGVNTAAGESSVDMGIENNEGLNTVAEEMSMSPLESNRENQDLEKHGDRLAILHSMLDVSIKTKAWTKPSTNPEYMDIAESEAIKREAIKQEAEKRNDRVAVLDGMLATATCRYLQSTGQTWLETDMVKNISRNSDSSVENYPGVNTAAGESSVDMGIENNEGLNTVAEEMSMSPLESNRENQDLEKHGDKKATSSCRKRKLELTNILRELKRQKISLCEWRPTCFEINFREGENVLDSAPLPQTLTDIIHTMLEDQFTLEALKMIESRLSLKYHPQPQTIRAVINILLHTESQTEAERASSLLHNVLRLHPPIDSASQDMYKEALAGNIKDRGISSEWDMINSCFSDILMRRSERSLQNNILFLRFVKTLLQLNLQHTLLHGHLKKSRSRHLLLWVLWYPSYVVTFNTRCRQLLAHFASFVSRYKSKHTDRHRQIELVETVCWLVAMVAECIRRVECPSLPGVHCLTSSTMSLFLTDVVKHLKDVSCWSDLCHILMSFQLPWFSTGVCDHLLQHLDDSLCQQTEVCQTLSLTHIVRHHTLLLPEFHISPKLIKASGSLPTSSRRENQKYKQSTKTGSHDQTQTDQCKELKKVLKKNEKGETTLHRACIKNNVANLKQLLSIPGIDVNVKDNFGWTPLHEACNHGNIKCVAELLNFVPTRTVDSYFNTGTARSKKVDILATNNEKITPLHDAVMNERHQVCRLLLDHGGPALLTPVTVLGYTPLQLAKDLEMYNLLCSYTTPKKKRLSQSQESITSSQESVLSCDTCPDLPTDHLYEEATHFNGVRVYSKSGQVLMYINLLTALIKFYIQAAHLDKIQNQILEKKLSRQQVRNTDVKDLLKSEENHSNEEGSELCKAWSKNIGYSPLHNSDLMDGSEASYSTLTGAGNDDTSLDVECSQQDLHVMSHLDKYIKMFTAHLTKIHHQKDKHAVESALLELTILADCYAAT